MELGFGTMEVGYCPGRSIMEPSGVLETFCILIQWWLLAYIHKHLPSCTLKVYALYYMGITLQV